MEVIVECSDSMRGTTNVYGIPIEELVRCKDCKWHEKNGCEYLNLWMMHMDDWFCADGERKEKMDEIHSNI